MATSLRSSRLLLVPSFGAIAILLLLAHGATAQSASGTITGRVMWSNCIRAIPLPLTPGAQAQPGGSGQAQPGAPAQIQPQPANPDQIPPQPGTPDQNQSPSVQGLPAGAVLVAVQGTAVNARTDETGKFSLSGVPAGQYLTVAAGPVANASAAIAERPNVFVSGGQSVDVGTLSLGGGGPSPYGFPCRVVPGQGAAEGAPTTPNVTSPATTPPDVTAPPPTGSPTP